MKTYYLIRHGISTLSKHGYGSEIFSAHLLPQARPAIEKVATFLKKIPTDIQISSQLPRAIETAQIITEVTGKTFTTDARLNEYSAEENYTNETFEEFRQRILSFLLELEQSQAKTILLCTHGSVIAGIKHILTEGRFTFEERLDYAEPGTLCIIQPDGKILETTGN